MPAIRKKTPRKNHLRQKVSVNLDAVDRNCGCLFMDSGAHSLYSIHVIDVGHKHGYKFYKSSEFRKYVDRYAAFLKEHKHGVDLYANVDVIFNPELSWQTLKYLEQEHGLSPMPVIHYGTEMKWIDKHLEAGYEYLGIGGLGQEASRWAYEHWADRVYERLCPPPQRLPLVKTHGFAMTSHRLMLRYPWYSVDSASWAKVAGYGWVYVPFKRNGHFVFDKSPNIISFSHRSKFRKEEGRHYDNLRPLEKQIMIEWLDFINMPFGKIDKDGVAVEYGVSSQYNARAVANILFFEKLCEWLPKWPHPFKIQPRTGFIEWGKVK